MFLSWVSCCFWSIITGEFCKIRTKINSEHTIIFESFEFKLKLGQYRVKSELWSIKTINIEIYGTKNFDIQN